ncbi:MAG: AEC family transporter [Proteobacteria bacterium]|nr:AEC family transporter [Pseudomonadota bacterium]
MNSVLEITVPVFGIGLLGYLATRLGWFSEQAGEGLAAFVFNFAIPALLLRTFANADLPENLPLDLIGSYYLPVAVFYLSGMLIARYLFDRPLGGQVITGFSFSYGNAVLLGLPLVLLTLGDEGALPYFILLSMHALSLFTVTTVLLEYSRHREASPLHILGKVFFGLLKNPILLGIIGGITLNWLGVPLTGVIDTTAGYLQNSVAACSLFALGASMTKYRIAGQLRQSVTVVLAKNIAFPVCVYFTCTQVFALPAHWTFVAVLMAAQPTGVNAYIFAERYQTAQALATTTVFLSTAFSLLTISALLYLYQSGAF